MKATFTLVVLAACFTAGAIYLFDLHFSAGDVYPEYSTLRADPSGAKLLYESLARLPQLTVSRNLTPLSVVGGSGATILLLGWQPTAETIDDIEKLAKKGNRVVAAMADDLDPAADFNKDLNEAWGVRLNSGRTTYFIEARDWQVIDRDGPKLRIIERAFGTGKIVLFAASDRFANFASLAGDSLDRVTEAIGPNSRVIFDESHFGIAETGSLVGLARRFHLTGFGIGLAICTALFLWRSAAAFPPASPAIRDQNLAGRTSHAGLLTLLRRHIPEPEIAAACWREWLAVNRRTVPSDRIEKAAAIIQASGEPLEVVRQTHAVLKGTL